MNEISYDEALKICVNKIAEQTYIYWDLKESNNDPKIIKFIENQLHLNKYIGIFVDRIYKKIEKYDNNSNR